MSILTDRKYVDLLSTSLNQFVKKDSNVWNARCPFCGDSQKNKFKKRFYIFERKGVLLWKCHNCNLSGRLSQLIQKVNPSLYQEYLLETFGEKTKPKVPNETFVKTSKPVFKEKTIDLPRLDKLTEEHLAVKYVNSRKLPKSLAESLYYADDFKKFVEEINPANSKNAKNLVAGEKRLIIPFYDENKKLLGFQGRALYNTEIRYITIKLDDAYKKVYGLDHIDFTKRVYVFEGPFDSSFIPNSVAAMDSDLYGLADHLKEAVDVTYVYDNEPRNKDIIRAMTRTIDMGYEVCVWPSHILQKDINDMILSGMSASIIQSIIDQHTFHDLKATMELNIWKKRT